MNSNEYEIIMNSRKLIKSQNEEEKSKGLALLEDLANQRNKYALYELALLYKEGIYVEKNIKKACNLFVFSGELGNNKSFYDVGKIFLENKDYDTAKRYFEKAKFSPQAFFELGKMAYYGKGINQSSHKAFSYFYSASKLGCPEADYFLAEAFILGNGIGVDSKKGIYYLKRALRKGIKDKAHLQKIIETNRKGDKIFNSIN